MKVGSIVAAVAIAAATGIPAAHAAGPAVSTTDLALFGKDPGEERATACYVRRYDTAHLKAHPAQHVNQMLMFVNSEIDANVGRLYTLEIAVNFNGLDKPLRVTGGCLAPDDPAAPLHCGVDCDGGEIGVRVRDENSVLVSIPYGARTWDPDAPEDEEPNGEPAGSFGPDDKLFRLDRTALKDCLPLVDDETRASMLATP